MGGNSSQIGVGSPSPVPMQMQGQLQPTPQLLSQQAHQLLEEAKNENRMLEDTVATLKEQVNKKNYLELLISYIMTCLQSLNIIYYKL